MHDGMKINRVKTGAHNTQTPFRQRG